MLKQIFKLRFPVIQQVLNLNTQKNFNVITKQFKFLSTSTKTEDVQTTELQLQTVDADREKKKQILYLEVDVCRQEGRRVPNPDLIKSDQWDHLLSLPSRSARSKYYLFLWHLEKKRENKVIKKIQNSERIEERKAKEKLESEQNDHIIYAINHTTIFLRLYDSTINHWNNNKLIRAIQFGQKIVIDCSYDEHMIKREAVNTAKQLMLCFADNRTHDDPFDVHYCNANFQETTMKCFEKHVPTMREPGFPMNVHEKCFTEIFPKEKLVYLTPHCRHDLLEYNHDDIYIVGGIVDKINNEPISLAKAKKLGLRMARLPLDHYLSWSAGSGKSLTLNQVVNILLDVKKTGDWNFALRHVPRRKLVKNENQDEQKLKIRSKKFDFNIENWGNKKPKKSATYTSFKKPSENVRTVSINSEKNPFRF